MAKEKMLTPVWWCRASDGADTTRTASGRPVGGAESRCSTCSHLGGARRVTKMCRRLPTVASMPPALLWATPRRP